MFFYAYKKSKSKPHKRTVPHRGKFRFQAAPSAVDTSARGSDTHPRSSGTLGTTGKCREHVDGRILLGMVRSTMFPTRICRGRFWPDDAVRVVWRERVWSDHDWRWRIGNVSVMRDGK